jgi:type II secretory pathway component PulJ
MKKGLTLIEVLVYVSLLSVMLVSIFNSLYDFVFNSYKEVDQEKINYYSNINLYE